MIIFNEKKYGEKIYKDGFSHYNGRNIERCVFIRYLFNEGLSFNEIIKELKERKISGDELISDLDLTLIYDKLIKKALQYPYIDDFKIEIYRNEYDFLASIKDTKVQIIAFCLLIYYKWTINNSSLYFFRGKNKDRWCIDPEFDIFKIAHLSSLRPKARNSILRELQKMEYYYTEVINKESRTNLYMFINIPTEEKKYDVVWTIDGENDIYGEFLLLFEEKKYKRCHSCGKIIKIKSNHQKWCENCARNMKISSTVENRKLKKANK